MVFERNIKSFNKAMNNDYHMEIEDDDGYEYNTELIKNLQSVVKKYENFKGRSPIKGLKADYLAERSIPDNIKLEGE